MSEYDCFKEIMFDCLNEFDERKNITITRNTGSTINGQFVKSVGATFTLNALTVTPTKELINETTLESDDILLIADYQHELKMNDSVEIDSKSYNIVKVESINPGGVVIGYKALLRK